MNGRDKEREGKSMKIKPVKSLPRLTKKATKIKNKINSSKNNNISNNNNSNNNNNN